MNEKQFYEFRFELAKLLTKYGVVITTQTAQCLMEYPAIVFKDKDNSYWSLDSDGFPASEIDSTEVWGLTKSE